MSSVSRRSFVQLAAVAVVVVPAARALSGASAARPSTGRFEVNLTEAQWRAKLSPAAFLVLRQEDTERAFTSPLNDEHRRGIFACAGCALPLYSSTTKFDSGTGWPSFWAPLQRRPHPRRRFARHGADRGPLPPLRWPPRPCLRRRSEADGAALLHERGGDDLRPRQGMRGNGMNKLILAGIAAIAVSATLAGRASSADAMRVVPAPALDLPAANAPAVAVLAGGCFWGLEGVFDHVAGVKSVTSGYAGGKAATAHYEVVATGLTGHAESVRIVYDPAKISYGALLRIYFSVATDPTELNHQEPDDGTQYRGTVFAQNAAQAQEAAAYIAQLNRAKAFPQPVVTTVESGKAFYAAEAYHQHFLERNPTYPYIVYNDLPKVEALKKLFPAVYR